MTSLFSLEGRTAVVTGGNGGIGRAIAVGLAGAGANVVVAARTVSKNDEVVKTITDAGGNAIAVTCDITCSADVAEVLSATIDRFGGLEILVANAGIGPAARLQDVTQADWDSVIDTNLSSLFRFCQLAYPHLKLSGVGRIITISSEYATFANPTVAAYCASKGGVDQITKAMAIGWAADGIRVNAIVPGWVWSGLTAPLADDANEGMRARIIERTPLRRILDPEELAGTAVYLASDAAAAVTGQCIAVDGGYSVT